MKEVRVSPEISTEICLGIQGEHAARVLIFDLTEWQQLYGIGKLELLVIPRKSDPYPAFLEQTGAEARWIVSSSDTAAAGKGKIQLMYVVDNTVAKSKEVDTIIYKTMIETGKVPPPTHQCWVDNVLQAAANVEAAQAHGPQIVDGFWHVWDFETGKYVNTNVRAEGSSDPGGSGTDGKSAYEIAVKNGFRGTEKEWLASLNGKDGFSPSANVSKTEKTTTITITDKTGKTEAQVMDGKDGFSPNAKVSKLGTTTTISITDKDGKTEAQVMDGKDGKDAISPTATVSKVGKTTTLTVTDKNGTTTAEILDGKDGGESGVPQDLVDKVNKNTRDIANKLDKNQGAENSGKILGINADGNVLPVEKPSGERFSYLVVKPTVANSIVTQELQPNTYYEWGELTELNITLGAEKEGITNEFCFEFKSGEAPTKVTFPQEIQWDTSFKVEANKTYQVSIINEIGVFVNA